MSTITFQCYACKQVLQVDGDKGGLKARCTRCGAILTIPIQAAAADEEVLVPEIVDEPETPMAPPAALPVASPIAADETLDRQRRDKRRPDDESPPGFPWQPSWAKVCLGLFISLISLCVLAGAYAFEQLCVLVITALAMGGVIGGRSDAVNALIVLALVVGFLAQVAATVGYGFWIFVKNRHFAVPFALALIGVSCFGALLFFAVKLVPFLADGRGPYGAFILSDALRFRVGNALAPTLVNLFAAGHVMAIGLYALALAKMLRERRQETRAFRLVLFSAIAAGYQLLWPLLVAASTSVIGPSRMSMALSWLLYWAGAGWNIFLYLYLLWTLKHSREAAEARLGMYGDT